MFKLTHRIQIFLNIRSNITDNQKLFAFICVFVFILFFLVRQHSIVFNSPDSTARFLGSVIKFYSNTPKHLFNPSMLTFPFLPSECCSEHTWVSRSKAQRAAPVPSWVLTQRRQTEKYFFFAQNWTCPNLKKVFFSSFLFPTEIFLNTKGLCQPSTVHNQTASFSEKYNRSGSNLLHVSYCM